MKPDHPINIHNPARLHVYVSRDTRADLLIPHGIRPHTVTLARSWRASDQVTSRPALERGKVPPLNPLVSLQLPLQRFCNRGHLRPNRCPNRSQPILQAFAALACGLPLL
jgi:hypothetical protein